MNYWKVLLVGLASAGLAVASCSHPSGTGTTGTGGSNGTGGSGDCPAGSVGCPCIGTTCDQDLVCADLGGTGGKTECVTTGGGTGGTPGTGGSVATGGTSGTGGIVGTGGTQATGGSAATGGTPGTGGNGPGTGGTSATGGSPGTGGNPANNLVVNGDFSQADTNWHFENGAASVNNGQYCTTSINASALFGWQNMSTPLTLMNGQSYTLSYRASGSNNAVLHIKVAHAVGSFTPDDYETNPDDKLTTSLQTFTHTFTPTMGNDDNTGIAFFVMAGQNICIANVVLVAN